MSTRKQAGFSLVEVVVAVGVLAAVTGGILMLLPIIMRQMRDASDALVAQRMVGAVEGELDRIAVERGLSGLAGMVRTAGASGMTLTFVATKRSGAVSEIGVSTLPDSERYFLIEVWQFTSLPLSYDSAGALLPMQVRVSWPYMQPSSTGAVIVAEADRSSSTFTVAINR